MAVRRKRKPARRKAKKERPSIAPLERRLRRVEEGTLRRGFAASREAMAAMIVIRAIERATELSAEEGASRALRRALKAAQGPMAEFVQRHLQKTRKPTRRRKP